MHCAYIKLEYIIQNLSMYNYNLSGEALEYSGTLKEYVMSSSIDEYNNFL